MSEIKHIAIIQGHPDPRGGHMPAFIYRWYFRPHPEKNTLRLSGIGPLRESLTGMVDSPDAAKRERWLRKMVAFALDALGGKTDPTAVRALIEGPLLTYNGAIAFAVAALFMASAGYATLATGALPRWTGWVACISALLCLVSISSMYGEAVDSSGFYNAVGWGPAIVANLPLLIWFFSAAIAMIRKREASVPTPTCFG